MHSLAPVSPGSAVWSEMYGVVIAGAAKRSTSMTSVAGAAYAVSATAPDDGKLRIICFGAHPDDNEFRAGGVGAMWAAQGHHVMFVSVTNGDIGHWGMAGGPLAQRRTAEVERCAEILGVETQVLDIHGEMGLGKSRVIEELHHHWSQEGGAVFFAGCLSYGRHAPYAPWVALLREVLGLRDDDSDQDRREKITSRLATANPEWVEWAALVANLLGVPMPESDLLRSLDPKLRQQNLQRIVGGLITSEAEYHPPCWS